MSMTRPRSSFLRPAAITAFLLTLSLCVPAIAQVAPESSYEIHEWGLIRIGDRTETATSSFGATPPVVPDPIYDAVPAKPVIYFHPQADFAPETAIDVTISLPEGEIREIWPTPEGGAQPVHGSSHTWSQVTVEIDTPCGGELGPALTDPACMSLLDGGVCEAAEMELYLGNTPHCLSVGEPPVRSPVLLYNGYLASSETPVALWYPASGPSIINTSSYSIGPLWLIEGDTIFAIETLAPEESLLLGSVTDTFPATASQANLSRRILEALIARGLSTVEAGQFIGAWQPDVLATPYDWSVFGLYSSEQIDIAYPLTFDPPPASTVRALAFVVETDLPLQ